LLTKVGRTLQHAVDALIVSKRAIVDDIAHLLLWKTDAGSILTTIRREDAPLMRSDDTAVLEYDDWL